MPAGNWIMYGHALEQIMDGGVDLDSNSFRMTLVTSSYTPSQNADDAWSDISANEATGTGYTAGGKALTVTTTRSFNVVAIDCDDQSWTSSTITAKYAVIVKDADANGSLASTDVPVMYCNLETGGGSLSSSSGAFSVTINAAGLYTLTAAPS